MEMPIFKNIDDAQKITIINYSESCEALAGDILIKKDEEQAALYLLLEGELQVCDDEEVIAEIKPGEFVGELGFWAKQKRSATVRAKTACRYLKIDRKMLEDQGIENEILHQLDKNIIVAFTDRLKATNRAYSGSLKKQLELEKERNRFGSLFIAISFLISIALLVNHLLVTTTKITIYDPIFFWGYLLILFTPLMVYCIIEKIPLSALGFNKNGGKKTIIDCLWIAPIIILLAQVLPVLDQSLHLGLGLHSFTFQKPLWINPAYFIHSCVQEIIARGILLQSLINFFNGKKRFLSLIIASFMFGILHIHLGIATVCVTFFGGIIFGLLYMREKNIYGVSFVHGLLGLCVFGIGIIK